MRPKKITAHQRRESIERNNAGEAVAEVARTSGVDRATVHELPPWNMVEIGIVWIGGAARVNAIDAPRPHCFTGGSRELRYASNSGAALRPGPTLTRDPNSLTYRDCSS